nr:MAG TPA: hypothetical protein [Herelleviridae sp. ctsMP6]
MIIAKFYRPFFEKSLKYCVLKGRLMGLYTFIWAFRSCVE